MLEKAQELDQHLAESIAVLESPFVTTEKPMSVTGLQQGSIQSKLAEIKQRAQQRLADGVAKIDAAHEQGLAKVEAEMDKVVQKINKEIDDQLHEFAQSTNGGPV